VNAFAKAKHFLKIFNDVDLVSAQSRKTLSELLVFLRAANLLSLFAHKVVREDMLYELPENFRWHITSNINYSERQQYQVGIEIDRISSLLEGAGITPIFLKGAAYNIEKVVSLKGRTMSDIDILVSSSEIKKTEKRLLSLGWQAKELSNYDEKYYREFAHEIPPMFDPISGTTLDIHHNLYLPVSGKAPDESVLRQNIIATSENKLVFKKHMQALHTCVHLYWNEDVSSSLRDLYDFTCLCNAGAPEEFWDAIIKTAKNMNLSPLLYDVVCLSEYFFQLHCPLERKNQLRGHLNLFQRVRQSITRFVMKRALLPDTRTCTSISLQTCRFLAYLRGHLMKMPVHVLVPHMFRKLSMALRKD
jgi:hypothetical protein